MTHLQKIEKAKARLMLEHPYFGTLAAALKLQQSDNIESFLSDGVHLQYNDAYFDNASVEEVEFALANGAMHTVLKHQSRAGERYEWLWQLATDYTINAMLLKNGFGLPDRANFHQRFEGMYAEEVYEMLRSDIINEELSSDELLQEQAHDEQGKSNNDRVSEEGVESPREWNEKGDRPRQGAKSDSLNAKNANRNEVQHAEEEEPLEDMHALQEELKEHFEQIFQKLNRQGTLPKDLKFVVPEYFSHKVDWRELLYGYIASYAKSTYSFIPPNMKYLYRGIYLPSLSSDLLRIVIAVDTSGSVDETLLGTFLGEVGSIMQRYPNYEIDLITADAKVQSHKVFLPGEALEYEISGGGGTDFRPVFAYIDQQINYPTLLLYFTDGMGTFPETEPHYDVMWVMPEAKEISFGDVLVLNG
ncbi:Sll7028 protein [hydrothermal vent metagenome]|uniref:Sll7028 protein n=1 Tax=hydrothermal vent metagenome TaxID=652676 RepID=A0A1W1C5A7_9ZZZZ